MTLFQILMVIALLAPLTVGTGLNRPAATLAAFRRRQMPMFILFVILISTLFPLGVISGTAWLIRDGLKAGQQAVIVSRATQLYTEANLAAVLPSVLTPEAQQCRRARLSQSIDRAWQEAFYNETCKEDATLCAHNEQDYFERMRTSANPYNQPLVDIDTMARVSEPLYATGRSLFNGLEEAPATKTDAGCEEIQQAGWIAESSPVQFEGGLCLGACN